ncbi:hypothetical protein CTEN210_12843 [Chaetoceros tenuissimus]|uniref:Ornithine cyclodeaminase n=1 Tax=Chaetoceros tenuissimus TaxID=426638 RepID=A0AAD3D1Y4_9STRA|nr:hypothetical protein CTEN210_12843 [Chaetoceros tenuissimus]
MLILNEAQVRKCLTLELCIQANKAALATLLSTKGNHEKDSSSSFVPSSLPSNAVIPTRIGLPRTIHESSTSSQTQLPEDTTLFKPAAYYSTDNASSTLMGMKVISIRAKNPSIGKPTATATMTMLNAETGEVTSVLNATYLTAARTAAGSAISTQLCLEQKQLLHGQKDKHLVLFGAGIQAEMHIRLIQYILPNEIYKVTIVNRSLGRADNLKKTLEVEHPDVEYNVLNLDQQDRIHEIVATADVIATATNTEFPLFDWSHVNSNCHICGVGSYLDSSEEVSSTFVRDRCYTLSDTLDALNVGDLKLLEGNSEHYLGLLGDFLQNRISLDREKILQEKKCTFYKSTGTAIQDIFTADAVIQNAMKLGLGTNVDM